MLGTEEHSQLAFLCQHLFSEVKKQPGFIESKLSTLFLCSGFIQSQFYGFHFFVIKLFCLTKIEFHATKVFHGLRLF